MYRLIFFIFFVFLSSSVFSQTSEKIDVNKDIDLVKVYTQVVKEGYGTLKIYKELANANYFRSNYAESKKWFEKLFSEVEIIEPVHLYRYNQSLKALGIYSEEKETLTVIGTN